MKLCLDRSNTVDTEQQRIKFLESPEGRAQNPPPTDWEEWVIYGVNHVVAGDFLPNNIVLHWDKTDLYFYRETYRKAVGKMLDIYREDSILLDKLQTIPLTPEVHRQVLLQQKGLEQMRYFVGRVGSTLAERWSNLATSVRYEQTRHLLEQISFWGIREDDILRTLAQQPASALSGASRP